MSKRRTYRGYDGVELVADHLGEGPPVFLLHGGGQTRHAWAGTASVLADRGFEAISLDARGHGDSAWSPEGAYRRIDFARDLVAVAEQLACEPFLVGASLGGLASMLAAGQLGLPARGVVLVDIAPRMRPAGVERILNFMGSHPDGFASLADAADAVAAYLPHRPRPDDLSGLEKNLRRHDDGRLRWHWDPAFLALAAERGTGEPEEAEAAVAAIRAPILLVRGQLSDLLTDDEVAQFRAVVPHADYVDVSGAAHMVAGDQNDRFCAAVVDFLTRC